jgi:hypothetical protein
MFRAIAVHHQKLFSTSSLQYFTVHLVRSLVADSLLADSLVADSLVADSLVADILVADTIRSVNLCFEHMTKHK